MSVSSICYICEDPATQTCNSCGQPVCDEHFVASENLCVECAEDLDPSEHRTY
ncbi:MAG: hypothetical protein SV253_06785 [Halobacteria archaeon]|nr:hypothetical protein [Halobacteria archaeon]